MNDIECPYCGDRWQRECEDIGDDGEKDEVVCEKCNKPFIIETRVSVDFDCLPVDCERLGKKHHWTEYPDGKVCQTCHKCELKETKNA